MSFGSLFWRVFGIILLIVIGWWLLTFVFKVLGWIAWAAVAAACIAAVLYVVQKLKDR